ncbi:MAG: hypothetical protein ACI4NG_00795, partial [Candidatus Gallimonas sp.]
MKKTLRLIATVLIAMLSLTAFASCKDDATLNEWSTPVYAAVQTGGAVTVQPVIATDSEGNTILATATVKDPSGADVAVS